ncbi:MAG: bacteriocin [Bacteroidales bacterium]|nr:bacteriocin [Bacteroidales bacterium]
MKTIGKTKEKSAIQGFTTLNAKELMQIRGGDNAPITQKDHDF